MEVCCLLSASCMGVLPSCGSFWFTDTYPDKAEHKWDEHLILLNKNKVKRAYTRAKLWAWAKL